MFVFSFDMFIDCHMLDFCICRKFLKLFSNFNHFLTFFFFKIRLQIYFKKGFFMFCDLQWHANHIQFFSTNTIIWNDIRSFDLFNIQMLILIFTSFLTEVSSTTSMILIKILIIQIVEYVFCLFVKYDMLLMLINFLRAFLSFKFFCKHS